MPKGIIATEAEETVARGASYGSLAKTIGPVVESLVNGEVLRDLRGVGGGRPFTAAGLSKLPELLVEPPDDAMSVAAERVRLFDRGECPPYESSHREDMDPPKDVVMADVAGFYNALGLQPKGG